MPVVESTIHPVTFLLASLAVWRLTHLLVAEDGPWELFTRLRRAVGDGFWGGLLDCFYCLSLWIALPLAVVCGAGTAERLLLWPALSATAILLERATTPAVPPAEWSEDEAPETPREENEP